MNHSNDTANSDQVRNRLQTISGETATLFDVALLDLRSRLSQAELADFCSHCLAIANAGWRSSESADLLLRLAPSIKDKQRLLAVAALSETFSGYSYEPTYRYLQLVRDTGHAAPSVVLLEQAGLRVQTRYSHAAGLLSGYFETAQMIAIRYTPAEIQVWVAILDGMLEDERDSLNRFLKLVRNDAAIDWQQVRRMQLVSAQATLAYLDRYPRLEALFSADELDQINSLIVTHAKGDIETLMQEVVAFASIASAERHLLLELAAVFTDSEVLRAWLRPRDELPLDKPDVVRAWLEEGVTIAAGDARVLLAWVRVESRQSRETLANLRGQVAFLDHERTFSLVAEAICQNGVEVICDEQAALSQMPSGSQAVSAVQSDLLPGSDGRLITLPSTVNLFDLEADNFGFYKISLFHQLGYLEFGLFSQISDVLKVLSSFEDQVLIERLFMALEDARIDACLLRRYPGLQAQMAFQKQAALAVRKQPLTKASRWLEVLLRLSLGEREQTPELDALGADIPATVQVLQQVQQPAATVQVSLNAAATLYELIASHRQSVSATPDDFGNLMTLQELPEPIAYQGEIDVGEVASSLKIDALVEEWQEQMEAADEPGATLTSEAGIDDQIEIGDLKKGDVGEGVAMIIEQLEQELGLEAGTLDPKSPGVPAEFPGGTSGRTRDASRHLYDEWDYQINDYRSRWCTLFEHREMDLDGAYVVTTLREHQDLSRQIRNQLNRVRPEMLRKVKGVTEGEELDLERSIAYLVDRKAGLLPEDNIYVQRQRKDRDVSTLFLLDMSASTDDIVPDPDAPPLEYPEVDDDEFLVEFFKQQKARDDAARKIIDLEKESVLLMADALERLGDAYSVCGFSGYGREQVDYYLCKDFDDKFDAAAKARIGGIKPCRSTRMGPPIRHGTRRLVETGSRIKAMIIISDGYPQDHDYGTDRNSRDYGLMDTMKALSEAKQQGVLTYCLTVDPSGHDYLRAMCSDSQYMVIQDIVQLPHELSRVYRSLTG